MTENTETPDVAELRRLAEAATPGPWEADCFTVTQHWSRPEPWLTIAGDGVACGAYCYGGVARGIEELADAEFIAAANPAAVLALLDDADALRVELTHMREARDAARAEVERLTALWEGVREQVANGALCPMCCTGMTRRTVGMVCQLCGTDYGRADA